MSDSPMPTSEALNSAADLIEERGWVQGDDGWSEAPSARGLCLEGGIMAALGINLNDMLANRDAFRSCAAYVAVSEYLDTFSLFGWNDRARRTASEVIEVLRACAVIEASREREAVSA